MRSAAISQLYLGWCACYSDSRHAVDSWRLWEMWGVARDDGCLSSRRRVALGSGDVLLRLPRNRSHLHRNSARRSSRAPRTGRGLRRSSMWALPGLQFHVKRSARSARPARRLVLTPSRKGWVSACLAFRPPDHAGVRRMAPASGCADQAEPVRTPSSAV